MTDLTPITALGASTPADRKFGPLRISENADLALASLALRRGAGMPGGLGLDLPGPGGWSQGQGVAAYWTGPDQWMIEAEGRAAMDFAAELAVNAPGCSITEQSDAWTVFEITSDRGYSPIRALLEKLVNVDAEGFTPGSATRTGLHHISVFLIRRAEDHIAISSTRSMACDLWHVLQETAKRMYANRNEGCRTVSLNAGVAPMSASAPLIRILGNTALLFGRFTFILMITIINMSSPGQ